MPSPLPRWNQRVPSLDLPADGGLPCNSARSASTLPFSRPAQRSLLVTACTFAKSPLRDPLHRRLQRLCYLHRCSDCLPAGVTVAGWVSHPLKIAAFPRRTELCGLRDGGRIIRAPRRQLGALPSEALEKGGGKESQVDAKTPGISSLDPSRFEAETSPSSYLQLFPGTAVFLFSTADVSPPTRPKISVSASGPLD